MLEETVKKPEGQISIGTISAEMWRRLEATGVIPPNCKRMIVDIGYPMQPVTIYWECFTDQRTLDIVFDTIVNVVDRAKSEPEMERDRLEMKKLEGNPPL